MTHQGAVIVTGAAGFLGSAISVELASCRPVVGIDRRDPAEALRRAAPDVAWYNLDIADGDSLDRAFRDIRHKYRGIDFVLHFAAFYHFGSDWHPEYEHSNIRGTFNVLKSAIDTSVRRLVFASSIVAMDPGPHGESLTERIATTENSPYGRSKSLGEEMVHEAEDRLPNAVLRIGGVFSDWCELPPLYSLIKLWSGWPPLSRLIVGRGNTGFPYIHRHDLVRLVRACIDRHDALSDSETFLASQHGAVVHNQLFPIIHCFRMPKETRKPFHVPRGLVEPALRVKVAWGWVMRNMPCERPWMLNYADRPWVVDTSRARATLDWDCTPRLGVLERLPVILDRFHRDRRAWERRNRARNALKYCYLPDEFDAERRSTSRVQTDADVDW
jgi:nucleoside-diphosphate-sugar epimerase